MHLRTRLFAAACLVALGLLAVMPNAAATTYTVTSNPYTMSDTISLMELWDSYEISAANGARVSYSVTASGGGCVMLLFASGHAVTMSSTYYVAYSQENCVTTYSNTFPVGSNDGTDFSVLILTTSSTSVPYTVTINVQSPDATNLIIGIVVIAMIAAGVLIAFLVLRRRKAAAAPPPMLMPPPYTPPTQMPPGWPPQQPPQQPPYPPSSPP